MEQIKILLAEDDANLGLLLKEYLVAKGYNTTLRDDGDKAYDEFYSRYYKTEFRMRFYEWKRKRSLQRGYKFRVSFQNFNNKEIWINYSKK